MKNRIYFVFAGVMLVLFSSQAPAHTTGSSGGFLHTLTGEHILMVVLAAVCAAGLTQLFRRFR